MKNLITQLKSITNATQSQYDEVIVNYSKEQVLKELQDAGISKDEISDDEFDELLQEQIKQSKSFSKGAMAATGAFVFLELLG
jgi:hypothetical protein